MNKHISQFVMIIFCMTIPCIIMTAQSINSKRLKTNVPVTECDIKGAALGLPNNVDADTTIFAIAQEGFLFDSIGNRTIGTVEFIIIKFLKFRDNETMMQLWNYKGTTNADYQTKMFWRDTYLTKPQMADLKSTTPGGNVEYRYFLLRKSYYENNSENNNYESPLALTVGGVAIPFKTRWQNRKLNDFEENFSLGSVGGLKWKPACLNGGAFVPMLGIAKTTITLDSLNTNDKSGGMTIQTATDRSGLAVISGFMYESSSGIQLMVNVGWDHLKRRENIDWNFQGKPWFGFGIGYSIFTTSKPSAPGSSDQSTREE